MRVEQNYLEVNGSYLFDSEIEGPTFVVFSGIHGDEVSGICANQKLFNQLNNGEISLDFGRLIVVIKSNEQAILQKKRFVEFNMNRLFKDGVDGESYEIKRSKELMKILKESDYFLDLHSTSGPSIPFMYSEKQNIEFAKKLGLSHIIYGWDNISNGNISGDTENFVNRNGGVGITFEAGNHDSIDGEKNAYQMILNILSLLGMIEKGFFSEITAGKNVICIKDCYENKSGTFKYELENIDNFQIIKNGTLIGYDGQEPIYAKEDFILVMPTAEYAIKQYADVFFIGKLQNT